jgi:hypothetical protein
MRASWFFVAANTSIAEGGVDPSTESSKVTATNRILWTIDREFTDSYRSVMVVSVMIETGLQLESVFCNVRKKRLSIVREGELAFEERKADPRRLTRGGLASCWSGLGPSRLPCAMWTQSHHCSPIPLLDRS